MPVNINTILYTLLLTYLFSISISKSYAGLIDTGFEATYEVYYTEFYLGDTVRKLTKQNQHTWTYSSHTRPKGFASAFVSDNIDEVSVIKNGDLNYNPISYSYNQYGGKKEIAFKLKFDWSAKQLSNSYTKKTYPLKTSSHDLLSFQIQLMKDMQANKKSVSYTIADKKRIDTYHLTFIQSELLETPLKTYSTIKLESNKIRNKMQFIIWCAPEFDYLPIKVVRIDKKGRESVMLLKSVSPK